MEITVLCAVVAALRVVPNRSQFFMYESVNVSCGQQGNSSEWRVKRNTSRYINQDCFNSNNGINGSYCFIDDLYPSDTGVYWCESEAGECRDAVNITVTAGPVILESPVHPVMEGDDVTLRCTNRETPSSNLTTHFYKDGSVIRTGPAGNMTVHRVSKADEGLYMCRISGAESPDSWLTVTLRGLDGGFPDPPEFTLSRILFPVVVVCLSLVSLTLFCLWRSHKGKADSDVSYSDIIITQEVQPKRSRETGIRKTFYTKIKTGST